MGKYNYIIFDLDGTIMDTSKGIIDAVKYTIEKLGLSELPQELEKTFIGPPIYESFQKCYKLTDDERVFATETFRNVYKDRFLFEAIPYDGIYELLNALKSAGIKTAIATNKRIDYTMKLLEHFDFLGIFDTIKGSDYENKLKKKDIIANAITALNASIDECVMVGDTLGDYWGAKENGIDFIGVLYGFGSWKNVDFIENRDLRLVDSIDILKMELL